MEPNFLLAFPSEPTRILKQPEYKVVLRGRSVVFECKVKHDPSLIPTMTWLKDDGELPGDERSELCHFLNFNIAHSSFSCNGSSQYLMNNLTFNEVTLLTRVIAKGIV